MKRTALSLLIAVTLFWTLARHGGDARTSKTEAAPAVCVVTPPEPLAPAQPQASARKKLALAPAVPAATRGERLREKGEAFGGGN
jgi:hypothetical protein